MLQVALTLQGFTLHDFQKYNLFTRGYLARDFIFFGVQTKYLAHIGAKKFEFTEQFV